MDWDPTRIHNDEGKAPAIAFTVDAARVGHYSDIVEHMVSIELARCKTEGITPTKQQVDFLRKEITRYAIIRRDVETAQKIKITKSSILYE